MREYLEDYTLTHDLGHQRKCRYTVGLRLFDPDSQQDLVSFLQKSDAKSVMFMKNEMPGWLPESYALRATDVRWPLVSADTESTKAGSRSIVRITGTPESQYEVTFLECGKSDLVKTFEAINSFMFPGNGLQWAPADYALVLSIGIGRPGLLTWEGEYLVALQNISLDASARETNTLMEIPVTFTQLDPYMLGG